MSRAAQTTSAASSVEVVNVPFQHDPIAAKRVEPILAKIRDLSLRRGETGLGEFLSIFRKERVGPEEFKSDLVAFGISLSASENEAIFAAFRDVIGYLMVGHFVDALLAVLPPLSTQAVVEAFNTFPVVPLTQVGTKRRDLYPTLAAPLSQMLLKYRPESDVACYFGRRSPDAAATLLSEAAAAAKGRPLQEPHMTLLELHAYYTGWYATLTASNRAITDIAFATSIEQAWSIGGDALRAADSTTLQATGGPDQSPLCSETLCRTLVATALPHKSKFAEIREEIDRPSRVVGYQGHMMTAQEHFGETFHRVEASLPPFNGVPPPYDALSDYQDYAHAFVRQGNKANTHNFRFA